jgi:AcrR family transcriptional regulator
MVRREPKVRDTRDRIRAAALEVFAAKGFAATSVDNIVARAGCTRGAFYYYFESKEDIARDLQRDLWHQLTERANEAFDPDLGSITNLKRVFDVHRGALADLGEARFFLREGFLDPIREASDRDELKWGVSQIRDLLVEAMDRGEVVTVESGALAALLAGLFEVATMHLLEVSDPAPTVEVVHVLLDGLASTRSDAAESRRSGAPTRDAVVHTPSDTRPPQTVTLMSADDR